MSDSMSIVLIIGGTSGIGEASAKRFHGMGKKVIVTGRREDRLKELALSLPGLGTYRMDNTDLAAIPSHVAKIFEQFPDIDTVWSNSGILNSFNITNIDSTTDSAVIDEVTTNVTGPMLLARHIIPRLAARDSPTTYMITTSRLGLLPNGTIFPVYSATKAALHALAVGIRQTVKDKKMNVIEIVPPLVGTDMEKALRSVRGNAPVISLQEFEDAIFDSLENKTGHELKEIGAGGALEAITAWRAGMGQLLEGTAG